jgi:hypothetical protein
VTEGGYDLRALETSLEAVIHSLAGNSSAPASQWAATSGRSDRGRKAVDAARSALSPFWRLR